MTPTQTPLRRAHVVAPVAIAVAAAGLIGLRYGAQGAGNVYTDTARAFYLEDPVLGWTLTHERWLWLGLDALGLVLTLGLGTLAMAWLSGLLARKHRAGALGRSPVRLALTSFWIGAALCAVTPALPLAAFASGLPPAEARAHLPTAARPTLPAPDEPALAQRWSHLPAGRYEVLPHPEANAVVARLTAGGETFEARFSPVTGAATLAPHDLSATTVAFTVPAASVDTGIPLRSSHARDDLRANDHPSIVLTTERLARVAPDGPDAIRFEGDATVTLMGAKLTLPIRGTVRRLDADARNALGVSTAEALLVTASLELSLDRTPLGADAFDRPEAPLSIRLLLAPAPAAPR